MIDHQLESNTSQLTFYQRPLADIEGKPLEGKTKYAYKDIILCKFKSTMSTVKDFDLEMIGAVTNTMNNRFGDISDFLDFKYLVQILNTHTWPKTEKQLAILEDPEMVELSQHFNDLLRGLAGEATA